MQRFELPHPEVVIHQTGNKVLATASDQRTRARFAVPTQIIAAVVSIATCHSWYVNPGTETEAWLDRIR
jgi:hypothetical protein